MAHKFLSANNDAAADAQLCNVEQIIQGLRWESHRLRDPWRCLVLGRVASARPFEKFELVRDCEEPFDVIVAGYDSDERSRMDSDFQEIILRSGNPAAPVIATTSLLADRADILLTDYCEASYVLALSRLESLRRRLVKLPNSEVVADRPALSCLIWAETRGKSIEARWDPNCANAIHYPHLPGVANPRPLLEQMAEYGLLKRRFFDRLFVCSSCDSQRLLAREVCPSCRSSHLQEHALVHHYQCGFQAPEAHFLGANGYSCPKCRRVLQHYGVDYDKPGRVIECKACHGLIDEPDGWFVCVDCGAQEASDHSVTRDWFHYDITSDGVAAVRLGSLSSPTVANGENRRLSLRDFLLLVRHHQTLARRSGKSLNGLRLKIDLPRLRSEVGQRRANEVSNLIKEIAGQGFDESDIFVVAEDGLIACLPDRDPHAANEIASRIQRQLSQMVKPKLNMAIDIVEAGEISRLLGDGK